MPIAQCWLQQVRFAATIAALKGFLVLGAISCILHWLLFSMLFREPISCWRCECHFSGDSGLR